MTRAKSKPTDDSDPEQLAAVERLRAELENATQAERCQWLEANTLRIRNNELRAEVERLRAYIAADPMRACYEEAEAERDALQAEVERLRAALAPFVKAGMVEDVTDG